MKKIIITFCLCAGICFVSKAQGNLQFSQVKYIHLTGGGVLSYAIVDTFDIVVPANRIWKIESAVANGLSSGVPTDFASEVAAISLDGVLISSTARGGYTMNRPLPIWLPEGTYKLAMVAFTSATSKGHISAIEFIITP